MKFTILISILFTTYISAATQIVVGTYSKSNSAISNKDELNNIINEAPELKKLLKKHNIKSVTKQDGKYFIVTLEPLLNKNIQTEILEKIRATKFKDAYVLKLQMQEPEIPKEFKTKEVEIEEIEVEDVKPKEIEEVEKVKDIKSKENIDGVKVEEVTPVVIKENPIKKEIKKETKKESTKAKVLKKQEDNFVQEYMVEIIASIAILILVVIYIFILRNKQKKLQDDTDDIIIVDNDIEDYEDNNQETIDQHDNSTEEVTQKDEDLVAVPDGTSIDMITNEIDDDSQPDLLKSSVQKKEIPAHNKINKDDFKEFEGMRVMVAEDNLINQKVIKGLLSESGIQLTIVDDGEEVLKHLKEDDAFCIILMDVNMPNMDGFEATRIIRSNPKYSHITVIALSGDVAADDIANMRACGMQENLEKPLKMDNLYDILYGYGYQRKDKIDIHNGDSKGSQTQELDIETGIEVCGGDEDFYKEILRDFLNSYEGSTTKIQDYLNNNDIDSVQKILLDITGLTANIGANNLQELLKNLKQELKNPEDKEYIETFKKYALHFEALEEEVKEYLS